MIDIQSINDLELLRESVDLEAKLANGRDGKGAVPEDFWPTYSSFANTEGGVVLLGVWEKQGRFLVEGIVDVAKVRRELFDSLNNRQKVSVNLLSDAQVREIVLDGRIVMVVDIPRATRKQRPVYLTTNPFAGHTYRRLNEGDRPLPDDEVKRMLAEQVEDSRDDRVLAGYDVDDLDAGTFQAYRQVFANRDPNHPWNVLKDREYLRQIGGWRKDRETEKSGITAAGLLMFGQMASIQEEFPYFMLDYQERPEPKTELRWVDRVALALAASEGTVNHARLRAVTTEHPVDLSKTLQHLTQIGVLESTGGRGAVYHLPGEAIPTPEEVFGPRSQIISTSSLHLPASSLHLPASSPILVNNPGSGKEHRDAEGRLVSSQLPFPVIDDLARLSPGWMKRLNELASLPRLKRKVDREVLIEVILKICDGQFVTLRSLAEIVNRKPVALQNQYLSKLVADRRLTLAFPTTPTHERQAYCTAIKMSS